MEETRYIAMRINSDRAVVGAPLAGFSSIQDFMRYAKANHWRVEDLMLYKVVAGHDPYCNSFETIARELYATPTTTWKWKDANQT